MSIFNFTKNVFNFMKNYEMQKKHNLLIINHLPPSLQKSCHKNIFAMKKKILFLGIFASLFFGCEKTEEPTPEPGPKREIFKFQKITRKLKGGTIITAKQVLEQIPEAKKKNYILKDISISDPTIAEIIGEKPNFSIKIKKAGTFKINILLEKKGFLDTELTGEVEVVLHQAIFQKLTITNGKNVITKNEILGQIQGLSGIKYTLKSIVIPANKDDFAIVMGNKPNFQIDILKIGKFTAHIVLEKSGFLDIILNNCEFEVVKKGARFEKLTITNGKNVIIKNEILEQIKGLTGVNYTIQNIVIPSNQSEFAEVERVPNLQIKIKKAGNFTAKIILGKQGFLDVKIDNCPFEIQNKTFTFQKLEHTGGAKMISTNQIFSQIAGDETTGYKLKNIVLQDASFGTVQTDFSDYWIRISLLKIGNFKAKIILEKAGFLDVEIDNCEFEIKNKNASFEEITKTKGTKTITKEQILGQIRGLTNLNYTIKNIVIPQNKLQIAEVEGSKPDFSIKLKKAGNFTATIILEKVGFLDVAIQNCKFHKQAFWYAYARVDLSYQDKKAEGYAVARGLLNYNHERANTYLEYYNYAITTIKYDHEKAKAYAILFTIAYDYAKTTLNYGNQKAKYYAKARAGLGFNQAVSQKYAAAYLKGATTLNYRDIKARYYAYAVAKLNYDDARAQQHADAYDRARNVLNYGDEKAQLFVHLKLNLNFDNAKAERYVTQYEHARNTLNYVDAKAQAYAHAKVGFNWGDPISQRYAEHYHYAITTINYQDDKKAQLYGRIRAMHNYDDTKSQAYVTAYFHAKTSFSYSDQQARIYALRKAIMGYDDAKARAYSAHYNYAKTTLNYNDRKAEIYALARAILRYDDAKARAFIGHYDFARNTLNYGDQKAGYYANARVIKGYNQVKAIAYATEYYHAKTTLGFDTLKSGEYAYSRITFAGFTEAKSKQYAEHFAYSIRTLKYSRLKSFFFAFIQIDQTQKDKDGKDVVIKGLTRAEAKDFAYAKVDLKYSVSKAQFYALAISTYKYSATKAAHFAYARDVNGPLKYEDKKAKAYADARADHAFTEAQAKIYATNFIKAKGDPHNFDDLKAHKFAMAKVNGKTDAEAVTIANN